MLQYKKEVENMEFKLKDFNIEVNVTRMANLHYLEFTKEYHTLKDKHSFRELIYVDNGKIHVESDSYCGALCDKQLLIHKANEVHSLSCPKGTSPNVVIIGFECECEKLDVFSQAPISLSVEQIKILTEVVKEGRSVFLPPYDIPNTKDMKKRTDYPFGADQMIKAKLEMFLIELVRLTRTLSNSLATMSADSKTEEIFAYITTNYKEKITLDDLCFLFNTNKTTLCKNFKDIYGDTIITHINKLRIKKATTLMKEGHLNITQISSLVGYSSIHYFSRIFKTIEGCSPNEYLKSIKKAPL